jgi:hypothetical protein
MIKYLIDAGANVDHKDKDGRGLAFYVTSGSNSQDGVKSYINDITAS